MKCSHHCIVIHTFGTDCGRLIALIHCTSTTVQFRCCPRSLLTPETRIYVSSHPRNSIIQDPPSPPSPRKLSAPPRSSFVKHIGTPCQTVKMSHPMRKTLVRWRPLTNLLIVVHLSKQCADLSRYTRSPKPRPSVDFVRSCI